MFRGAHGCPGPTVTLAPSVTCPLGSRRMGRGPEVSPTWCARVTAPGTLTE